MSVRVAVIVPCLNEAVTVGAVVADVRAALPGATVYVYDNASQDDTAAVAAASGATVRHEPQRGKGNVVRRAFADVEADVYVLIDGDGTYDATVLPGMVELLLADRLDFVNGARQYVDEDRERGGHVLGNRLLSAAVQRLFGRRSRDVLSGCKVLSRRFVKSFPSVAAGFEIETELTVHALGLGVPTAELPVRYRERPANSFSKLRTFRDGWRILMTIARLARRERPVAVFGATAVMLAAGSVWLGVPVVVEFVRTGLVPRFPTAILAAAIGALAVLAVVAGLVLDAVQHARHEVKRLAYLAVPAPGRPADGAA